MDIDSDIISNLDNLITHNDKAIITRERNPNLFVQWCLMFEADHPILERTIQKCIENINKRNHYDICYITGPNVFTEAVSEVLGKPISDLYNNNHTFDDCRFFDYDFNGFCLFYNENRGSLYVKQKHWRSETKIFIE